MADPSAVGHESDVAGAILLGGSSRRMGRDKARVVVDGATLLTRTVRTVAAVAGSVTLVGGAPSGRRTGARDATLVPAQDTVVGTSPRISAVPDLRHDAGPLAGLETALRTHPDADAVLVVGVDHPWLQAPVLEALCRRLLEPDAEGGVPDAVMLGTDRGPQPLLAAYRPGAVDAVSRLLDAGERRLRVVADHLDVRVLARSEWRALDAFGASAVDADTPAELERAVRWQARVRATAATSIGPAGRAVPSLPVIQVRDGRISAADDPLIGEQPLEVRAAGPGQDPVTLMTTLRTPGHEREQAAGWLLAEAFARPDQILDVSIGNALELAQPEDTVTVSLSVPVDPGAGAHRHALATASCGVCGRASIDELAARTRPVTDDPFRTAPLAWDELVGLTDELRFAQSRFHATGGVHATGLFDADGRLVTVREDVGRHNALDAAIGAHVLSGDWPVSGLDDLVCVLSGRIGFELVAKAAVARLPIVAAVGAASDLAMRTADRLGITLIGFVRPGRGTIYTHPERLVLP